MENLKQAWVNGGRGHDSLKIASALNFQKWWKFKHALRLLCGAEEDFQGVLTFFCSGAAQVCHALRVDELSEQLEVEEEDGDRQEEEDEVESGEASQGECATWMTMDGGEMRSELEP